MSEWEALERMSQQLGSAEPRAEGRSLTAQLGDWWKRLLGVLNTPVPLWTLVVMALSAVVGLVAFGVLTGLNEVIDPPQAVQAQAITPAVTVASVLAEHDPTATPTLTPTPLPLPTPLPAPMVWAPAGDCAYARAKPAADAENVACLPNGTPVEFLGETQKANGFTWVSVAWPRVNDIPAGQGWMAYRVVVWDGFVPDAFTVQETPFLDANRGEVRRTLPMGTPLVVDHTEDGYAWAQLPNGEWGWVTVKDLDLER